MADNRLRTHTPIGSAGRRVAENLRRARMARGWTTGRLAQTAGTAGMPLLASTITKIESGARRVTVDEMVVLAEALSLDADALLAEDFEVRISGERRSS